MPHPHKKRWDHDFSYDNYAISVEKTSEAPAHFPYAVTAQLSRYKKDTHVTLDSTSSFWIRRNTYPVLTTGLDVDTIGNLN